MSSDSAVSSSKACCPCQTYDDTFDRTASAELLGPPKLEDICNKDVNYFFSRSLGDDTFAPFSPVDRWMGVYVLWRDGDFCVDHWHKGLTAIYVGKGYVDQRLYTHFRSKDFGDHVVYLSCINMPNRVAKYCEQLLLDTYHFEYNRGENPGTGTLRTCWDDDRLD